MNDETVTPLCVEVVALCRSDDVDVARLADWARRALAAEGVAEASLSVRIVDDAAIHALNRRWLDHDEATDVITFPLSEPGEARLAGEIVISAETAARVARERGIEPAHELALYLAHGVLHLLGQDDLCTDSSRAMRRRESELLARIGLPGDVFARGERSSPSTMPSPLPTNSSHTKSEWRERSRCSVTR
ncbi:MAG: rRNA maturation RNase YbeY [Planctomycetota bacterium]|nr:rRNA maturation RNase YbeY [Planctomycetota bacterium]